MTVPCVSGQLAAMHCHQKYAYNNLFSYQINKLELPSYLIIKTHPELFVNSESFYIIQLKMMK